MRSDEPIQIVFPILRSKISIGFRVFERNEKKKKVRRHRELAGFHDDDATTTSASLI